MRIERDGLPPLPDGASGPTHAFVIPGRSRREATGVEGAATHAFVILGRSSREAAGVEGAATHAFVILG
ncbi:MAG: hypothetical protein E5Y61_26635, partial [Mesorhizobium sp.]